MIKNLLYITRVHGKVKFGISGDLANRFANYNKGNQNYEVHALYVAVEGYEEHIMTCENYLIRTLYQYLENPKELSKPTEYVDPTFTEIDIDYVSNLVESKIKNHPLRIRRLKKEYTHTFGIDPDIMGKITLAPERYLEEIT